MDANQTKDICVETQGWNWERPQASHRTGLAVWTLYLYLEYHQYCHNCTIIFYIINIIIIVLSYYPRSHILLFPWQAKPAKTQVRLLRQPIKMSKFLDDGNCFFAIYAIIKIIKTTNYVPHQ